MGNPLPPCYSLPRPRTTVIKQRAPMNHGVHGLLTVITCGAWAVIWFIAWLVNLKKRKVIISER